MNLSAQIYKIILFKIQAPACQDSLSDSYIETYEEIGNTASGLPYIYSFQRGADGWAFLLYMFIIIYWRIIVEWNCSSGISLKHALTKL